MDSLRRVIARISDTIDERGAWTLPLSSLSSLLDVSELELYGRLYQTMHTTGNHRALTEVVFSEENAGELIDTIDLFCSCETEAAFTRAGLFLPQPLREDLQERIVRRFTTEFILHTVELTVFDGMLRAVRRADRAILLYLDEYFPLDRAIASVAEEFAGDGGFPDAMTGTAAAYLHLLFRRHVLDRADLLRSLLLLLRARARDLGYEDRHWAEEEQPAGEEDEVARARKVLGLDGEPLDRYRIREQYKSLIRKYHPDVNPNGLEMSKKLNTSYALLLSLCAD